MKLAVLLFLYCGEFVKNSIRSTSQMFYAGQVTLNTDYVVYVRRKGRFQSVHSENILPERLTLPDVNQGNRNSVTR